MPYKDLQKRKEYHRAYMKSYQKKLEYAAYRREWMKNWYKKNYKKIYKRRRSKPYEKIAATIRSRINDIVKHNYKSSKTEELLGMTVKELKQYIEKQFSAGMTWKNYGFYGWHIDHKIPLSSFDLTNKEEQKKAFHYTNLQPLWAKENLTKHAKVK